MTWLNSLLSDSCDGSVSSKRVVTIAAFLLCAFGFVASIFGYPMDTKIFDSMMYIVIAGLGFTATEKFVKKEIK